MMMQRKAGIDQVVQHPVCDTFLRAMDAPVAKEPNSAGDLAGNCPRKSLTVRHCIKDAKLPF